MENETVMQDSITPADFNQPALPPGLNVLTILSFIGCALQLLGIAWNFFNAKTAYDQKDAVMEKMNSAEMPAAAKAFMPDMTHFEEMIVKSYENRLPILIVGLVAFGLCLYGVMEMRKLKKQGFLFYVIGEILPFVSMVLFIGTFSLAGIFFYCIAFIALLFIFLYSLQRKNMIY
ncbi:MAG: hypothetical protein ABIT07_06100 [Ferruginibacter sp.]